MGIKYKQVNLLEKYIRLLLVEGRVDDARRANPRLSDDMINFLSKSDPSKNNKYLVWMAKQVEYNWQDKVIDIVNKFHNNIQRLPKDKRSINNYKTVKDLESELSKISDFSKRQQKKIVKKKGADIVFENDEVVVLIPKTHEASCYYGSNTKWCTASRDNSSNFNNYLGKVTLYYILPKDGGEKVAVAVGKGNKKEIFNSKDDGRSLNWLEGKLRQYNIPSSIFKYIPFTGMIEESDGTKKWYLNGELHREDGPAIEEINGSKHWYLNGELRREDGPAIEYSNGSKYWYLNGRYHREDGPAIEHSDGTKSWYINDQKYSENKYWKKVGLDKKEEYYKGLNK